MTDEKNLDTLIAFMILLLSLPLMILAQGVTLTHLWAWFVATRFHANPLTMPQALGLALTLRYAAGLMVTDKKQDDEEDEVKHTLVQALKGIVFVPGLTLAFGYVLYHSFVAV